MIYPHKGLVMTQFCREHIGYTVIFKTIFQDDWKTKMEMTKITITLPLFNLKINMHMTPFSHWKQGPWFNIKMSSYQYRKSHCGDKTILRSSYLHNGIPYTGKMTSLYWNRALAKHSWRTRPIPWLLMLQLVSMMTSSNGNIFRVTGHLCGEFTRDQWIPRTKASDTELWCFLWSASE